jgi:acetolactate synthase-1/3 small subunit
MAEISGQERKIEAFIEVMRPFGIIELVRTGRVALLRSGASSDDLEAEDQPSPEPPPEATV